MFFFLHLSFGSICFMLFVCVCVAYFVVFIPVFISFSCFFFFDLLINKYQVTFANANTFLPFLFPFNFFLLRFCLYIYIIFCACVFTFSASFCGFQFKIPYRFKYQEQRRENGFNSYLYSILNRRNVKKLGQNQNVKTTKDSFFPFILVKKDREREMEKNLKYKPNIVTKKNDHNEIGIIN